MSFHLWTNAEELRGWAGGNLLLLGNSIFFMYLIMGNLLLIISYPEFLEANRMIRVIPFIMAMVYNTYWYIGVIATIFKIKNTTDGTVWETNEELIFAYLLWIGTPGGIVATIYMYLMVTKTDDLAIGYSDRDGNRDGRRGDRGNDDSDDENDDDDRNDRRNDESDSDEDSVPVSEDNDDVVDV